MSAPITERRATAQAFVREVNARTVCAECGAQPIEWHNPAHLERPYFRVATLALQGRSVDRLRAEMEASTPLCRSCHMKVDGRSAALTEARPRKAGDCFAPKPCAACSQPFKPLRRGLCNRCSKRRYASDYCADRAEMGLDP